MFLFSNVLLQNILFIPCIISLAVSGMRLRKSIIKSKGKNNIKLEIIRHTVFSLMILLLLICSSLIEVYISKNILILFIKYF